MSKGEKGRPVETAFTANHGTTGTAYANTAASATRLSPRWTVVQCARAISRTTPVIGSTDTFAAADNPSARLPTTSAALDRPAARSKARPISSVDRRNGSEYALPSIRRSGGIDNTNAAAIDGNGSFAPILRARTMTPRPTAIHSRTSSAVVNASDEVGSIDQA